MTRMPSINPINPTKESLTAKDSLPLLVLYVLADIASKVTAILLQPVHSIAYKSEALCAFLNLARHVRQVAFLIALLWRRRTAFSECFAAFLLVQLHLFDHSLGWWTVWASDYIWS